MSTTDQLLTDILAELQTQGTTLDGAQAQLVTVHEYFDTLLGAGIGALALVVVVSVLNRFFFETK